ncbi:MAG: hypothetical protein D6689_16115 [Deltaproteobacteria bacterium]|nr:MAG: hypothetical protein D6689_16115 [Deltaproteobacteria bacterium]
MSSLDGAARARAIRQARARRLARRFVAWVVVPTLLSAVYYGCWASSQYVSEAVVAVRYGPDGKEGHLERDANLLRAYVQSRDLVRALDEALSLQEHFAAPQVDRWSRLAEDAPFEERYRYVRERIDTAFDKTAGTLTVRARAFTPEFAQAMCKEVLAALDKKVSALFPDDPHPPRLVILAEPSLPDVAALPKRGWRIATVFFVCLALMGIVGLAAAAIREHAKL